MNLQIENRQPIVAFLRTYLKTISKFQVSLNNSNLMVNQNMKNLRELT